MKLFSGGGRSKRIETLTTGDEERVCGCTLWTEVTDGGKWQASQAPRIEVGKL